MTKMKKLLDDLHIPCPDHIDRETGLPKKVVLEVYRSFAIGIYNNKFKVKLITGTKGHG